MDKTAEIEKRLSLEEKVKRLEETIHALRNQIQVLMGKVAELRWWIPVDDREH